MLATALAVPVLFVLAQVSGAPLDSDSARAAIQRLLARAAAADASAVRSALDSAGRLAEAIRLAGGDAFPSKTVARFAGWTSIQRHGKVRADSLRLAGNQAFAQEGPLAAIELWRRSVVEADAVGDSAGVAAGWGNLGSGWLAASNTDSARLYLDRSRKLALAIGDYRTTGNALASLADVAKSRGHLDDAQRLYRQAGDYRVRVGDTRGRAADLNNLGLIAEALGHLDSAASLYEKALALNQGAARDGAVATNLVNLGNLAALRGAYDEAAKKYERAIRIRSARDERPEQATVLYDLGLLEVRRGDYLAAQRHLRESFELYEEAGVPDGAVAALIALSNVCLHVGQVGEAVQQLRSAERLASGDGVEPVTRAELTLVGAELGLALSNLSDAGKRFDEAGRSYREIGDLGGQAAAAEGKAALLLRQGREAEARPYLVRALELRTDQGDLRAAARARLLLGHAELQAGAMQAARGDFDSAQTTFRRLGDDVGDAAATEGIGRLELRAGNPAGARHLFSMGLGKLRTSRSPALSWTLRSGLAEALQLLGDPESAARVLRSAIDEIEHARGLITVQQWREGYLADKWSVYGQLVRLEHRAGHSAAAFEVSERMRARQMLDQLSRGRIEAPSLEPEILATEQDLRHRITELVLAGENGPLQPNLHREATLTAGERASRERELAQAQRGYAQLLDHINETSPAYAGLVGGATTSFEEVSHRLGDADAILNYLVLDSLTIVFALTAHDIRSIEIPVNRETLAGLVDFTRDQVAQSGTDGSRQSWRPPLKRLYRALIEPVERAGVLQDKHRLLIVPHAELHYLPFAALLSDGPRETYLIERFELAYAPSVSSWVRLRGRTAGLPIRTALAVAPHPAMLPGTRSEVFEIGQRYGAGTLTLLGVEATEERFRQAVVDKDVVHLATYGVLNKRNPLFSYVQLQPDDSSDGRLEVHEAYGLGLRARVLILSACETGVSAGALSEVPAGDDWVGLVQAFLQAGAESVVATLWAIDDRATARLMGAFYANLIPTGSSSIALAQAQRTVLAAPETRAPFFWAGFTLSGIGS
jgi:CHAT domain-containing protein/Tfp pilus assembly protein PilF